MTRREAIALLGAGAAAAQEPPVEWVCPMDPEIRAKAPGRCSRCGMKLEPGILQPMDYRVTLEIDPPPAPAGKPIGLIFRVSDPKLGKQVTQFEIAHEKLFHVFLVSADLEHFAHQHPEARPDGSFRLDTVLPKPGYYRVLADFYPTGGTPQLVPLTIATERYAEPLRPAMLKPDLEPKLGFRLALDPWPALAGKETHVQFHTSREGLEPYLGAWGHLLVASEDLIDTIHGHPELIDDRLGIQFDVYFPREGNYKVWGQFQRNGEVVTVPFVVPVRAIR